MKTEDFRKKITQLSGTVELLTRDPGVKSNTALYGMLQTANFALAMALRHYGEYDEIFSKNYSNNQQLEKL